MKGFIKDSLIFILILVIFFGLVGGSSSPSSSLEDRIVEIENDIDEGNYVKDGEAKPLERKGNLFGKIIGFISNMVIFVFKKLISFITFIMNKFMG